MLLMVGTGVVVAEALVPPGVYLGACLGMFALVTAMSIIADRHWKRLINGFWFLPRY
jgi:hypothetical protein